MSGRISDIEAVEANPAIVYVGSASGGVWKSTNAGTTFIMLKPWGERNADNSVFNLAARAQQHFFSFRDAMVFAAVAVLLAAAGGVAEHHRRRVGPIARWVERA